MDERVRAEQLPFTKPVPGVGTFSLRLLRIPADIPVVHDWVTRDYAKYWGMQGKSVTEVEQMYREIVRPAHIHALLGFHDASPAFLVECYRPSEDSLAQHYNASPHDRGMHILVAPAEKPIAQFTWHAFTTVMDYLFSDPSVRRVVVEPDIRNEKIQALNLKAGFVPQKTIELPETPTTPGKTALLSFCTRESYVAAMSQGRGNG